MATATARRAGRTATLPKGTLTASLMPPLLAAIPCASQLLPFLVRGPWGAGPELSRLAIDSPPTRPFSRSLAKHHPVAFVFGCVLRLLIGADAERPVRYFAVILAVVVVTPPGGG